MQNLSYEDMRSALNHTSSNWRYVDNGEFCEESRTTEKANRQAIYGPQLSLSNYNFHVVGSVHAKHIRNDLATT